MSSPDYPILALGGYEAYQLAHIATYMAERLARHRHAERGRASRATRAEAVRDLAGAATALSNATGATIPDADLPRPLDDAIYARASRLTATGPRTAEVVALAGLGQRGFAVVGTVPGIGPVGARVPTQQIAEALRAHFLTQPAAELTAWAVTPSPQHVPTLPKLVDLARYVEHLDPDSDGDRAVARNLRGHNRRTDAAIRGRFARVDLDAPFVVTPRAATRPAPAAPRQRPGIARRVGLHPPARRAPTVAGKGQNAAAPTMNTGA